jgi:hypothetical protein
MSGEMLNMMVGSWTEVGDPSRLALKTLNDCRIAIQER